jgi:hypothetical protein
MKQQQQIEEANFEVTDGPLDHVLTTTPAPPPSIALSAPDGIELIRMTTDGVFVHGYGKMPDISDGTVINIAETVDAANAMFHAMMKFHAQWALAMKGQGR